MDTRNSLQPRHHQVGRGYIQTGNFCPAEFFIQQSKRGVWVRRGDLFGRWELKRDIFAESLERKREWYLTWILVKDKEFKADGDRTEPNLI